MTMTENSLRVLNYLKSVQGQDVTAQDVADALGYESKKTVDGTFTSLQKKGLGARVPAEIELEDGSHKQVKFLTLTDAGVAFNPETDLD